MRTAPLSESLPVYHQETRMLTLWYRRRDTIVKAVMDRLCQATPAENHACLLDACIEAMDRYA